MLPACWRSLPKTQSFGCRERRIPYGVVRLCAICLIGTLCAKRNWRGKGDRMVHDTVFVDPIIDRNKFFKTLGLAEITYKPGTRFMVRDSRIPVTHTVLICEDIQRRGMPDFQWLTQRLSTNRPEVLERLVPEDRFRCDGATAK